MDKLFLFLFLLLTSVAAAAERTDFDGDGISDLTAITIQSDGSLKWKYRSSKSTHIKSLSSLGTVGNHIALSHWSGAPKPELAVVSQAAGTTNMVWTIVQPTGELFSFNFGSTSDLAIAGADFDGNGLADAGAIEIRGGNYYWKLYLNPLSTTPVQVEIPWGVSGDIPFFWHDATGIDKIAVIRKDASNTSVVFLLDTTTRVATIIPLSRSIPSFERPFTIQNNSLTYLILPVKGTKLTKFYVFRSSGTLLRRITLNGSEDIVVGDFIKNAPGEEVAVKNEKNFSIYNPFTLKATTVRFTAQVPIDDININSLETWGGTSTGGGSNGGGSSNTCISQNPRDGTKKGFVWKPMSDTQHFAVAVIPANYTGRITKMEALTSDGTFIKEIGLKNCGNPDVVGYRCNYQDRSLTGADYKAQYGSIILKMSLNDGSCITFALDDPSKRID